MQQSDFLISLETKISDQDFSAVLKILATCKNIWNNIRLTKSINGINEQSRFRDMSD